MHPMEKLASKDSRLVIGLMSGTSADGIDAALVRIEGFPQRWNSWALSPIPTRRK